jgi:hypothetical protein
MGRKGRFRVLEKKKFGYWWSTEKNKYSAKEFDKVRSRGKSDDS